MRGSTFKRGKTWSIVYDEGRNENGKRVQRWRGGFETKKAAEEALTTALETITTGSYVKPVKQSVSEYLTEWLEAVAPTLRPSTHSSYTQIVKNHISPAIGGVPLQQLTASRISAFYGKLLKDGRKDNKPLSSRSVAYVHAILRHGLADAVRWGRIPRNPADMVDPPKPERPPMTTWTAGQLKTFLAYVATDDLSAAFRVLAMTGCRRGEALGVRWQDLDLDAKRFSIVQTLIAPNYKLAFSQPKNGKPRRVALDDGTVEALKAHRKRQVEQRLAFGPDWPATDLVFTNADGTPVHPVGFSKRFERRAQSAGLPRIKCHALRHTHATLGLANGIHPKVMSERLGHSSVSITLDVYSSVTEPMAGDAAASIAALVNAG